MGEQYRSIILYDTDEEQTTAGRLAREIQESLRDGSRVVTQIVPLLGFYPAENYHKNYYQTNASAPYCQLIIEPKVEKVRKRFAELVKHDA